MKPLFYRGLYFFPLFEQEKILSLFKNTRPMNYLKISATSALVLNWTSESVWQTEPARRYFRH